MKRRKPTSILFIKTGETFPAELKNAFSAECRRRGTTMTKTLAKLVRKWLENPTG